MNANVHTAVGLATATGVALILPQMQCNSMVGYGVCLGSAVVGSLIPDIDANGESKAKKEFRRVMLYLGAFTVAMVVAAYSNGTLVEMVKGFTSSVRGLGLIAFLVSCILGYMSEHRKFTHELRGLVCFTIPYTLMTNVQLGLWFGFGMLSHQFIDMLNKRKILWLYPLKLDFARYVCYASSKMSRMIGFICTCLTIIFYVMLLYIK